MAAAALRTAARHLAAPAALLAASQSSRCHEHDERGSQFAPERMWQRQLEALAGGPPPPRTSSQPAQPRVFCCYCGLPTFAHALKAQAAALRAQQAKRLASLASNAEANAEMKGLDVDELVVKHSQANRAPYQRRRTYRVHGRINPYMASPAHIEIVLCKAAEPVKKEDEEKKPQRPVWRSKLRGRSNSRQIGPFRRRLLDARRGVDESVRLVHERAESVATRKM